MAASTAAGVWWQRAQKPSVDPSDGVRRSEHAGASSTASASGGRSVRDRPPAVVPAPRPERATGNRAAASVQRTAERQPDPAPREDPVAVPAIEISRGHPGRSQVSLTFDAGASPTPTSAILRSLKEHQLRATFFLTGEWTTRHPALAREIASQGHEVANHSWDHADFTLLSRDEIRHQLARTDEAIRKATGRTSRPYFRPPLGARNDRVRRAVAEEGYFTLYWTLDSRDSVDQGITAAQISSRVLEGAAPGCIVLLHCGSAATAQALPTILQGLKERGLEQVTLTELLRQ